MLFKQSLKHVIWFWSRLFDFDLRSTIYILAYILCYHVLRTEIVLICFSKFDLIYLRS